MPVTSLDELYPTFQRLARAKDIQGLLELYEPNAVLSPQPGQTVQGHAAIGQALSGLLNLGENPTLTGRYIYQSPEGIALASCSWSVGPMTGTSAEVLRRQPDGSWKYILDNPFA